jgi:hypothetical protein
MILKIMGGSLYVAGRVGICHHRSHSARPSKRKAFPVQPSGLQVGEVLELKGEDVDSEPATRELSEHQECNPGGVAEDPEGKWVKGKGELVQRRASFVSFTQRCCDNIIIDARPVQFLAWAVGCRKAWNAGSPGS